MTTSSRVVSSLALAHARAGCTTSTQVARRPPPPPGPPPPGFRAPPPQFSALPRAIPTLRRPNVERLRALAGRGGYCAPREMGNGLWVKFDCGQERPVQRARPLSFGRLFTAMIPGAAGSTEGSFGGFGIPGMPQDFPGMPQGFPGMPQGFPPVPGMPPGFPFGQPASPTPPANPQSPASPAIGNLPPAVDLRAAGLDGPIKDQGAVGTCTAMSLSSAMEVGVRKVGKPDFVSALHVWSQYAIPSMGPAGDGTENRTLAVEQSWGYDPAKACALMRTPGDDCSEAYGVASGSGEFDPVLRGEKTAADNAGAWKLAQVEAFSKPANPDEMAAVLAGGDAIWMAFNLDPASWKSSAMTEGVIPDYVPTTDVGHAVTLVGYRTTPMGRQYLIHNSWGEEWGEGGYAWISERMVRENTRSAYKLVVEGYGLSSNGGQPVNPNGPAGPSANGCPQGQIPDAVTRQCAALCPSGSAPAAGVCLPSIPGFGPAPTQPGQPGAPQSTCPQGQVVDVFSGQCSAPCANGAPPAGGLCVPGLPGM